MHLRTGPVQDMAGGGLPKQVPILVVGGVKPEDMGKWREAGANGFGLGSGLYAPGRNADDVHARAKAYVAGARA